VGNAAHAVGTPCPPGRFPPFFPPSFFTLSFLVRYRLGPNVAASLAGFKEVSYPIRVPPFFLFPVSSFLSFFPFFFFFFFFSERGACAHRCGPWWACSSSFFPFSSSLFHFFFLVGRHEEIEVKKGGGAPRTSIDVVF